MKRIHFLTFSIRDVNKLLAAALFFVIIISTNIFYFSYYSSEFTSQTANPRYDSLQMQTSSNRDCKLAIIIEDFGSYRDDIDKIMSVKRHLTFAIIPFLERTRIDAELAHKKGFEVMAHIPYKSQANGNVSSIPSAIVAKMSRKDVYQISMDAMESVSYSFGASIHADNGLKDIESVLPYILDVLKVSGSYFVDTNSDKIGRITSPKDIVAYKADVVMDIEDSKEKMKKQLEKACTAAIENGTAVAVAHIGINNGGKTAEAIFEMLPTFDKKNIRLVFVSELLNRNH